MTKFSNKFKNPLFWPIFAHFLYIWGKNIFLALSHATPHGPVTPCKFQKILMSQSQRNFWREGQTNRQTLYHMTLQEKGWMSNNYKVILAFIFYILLWGTIEQRIYRLKNFPGFKSHKPIIIDASTNSH